MPLRAVVEGREVQVWDLTRDEWAGLRQRSRAEAEAVVMACCGAPGLAKTSRNGNPFFAHRGQRGPGAAACRWAAEGAAHALCKLLAAVGARRAGWDVWTEAAAPDGAWRADVLCVRGAAKVALEAQLARTSPGELRARQERYAAAGVRGAWFVPPALCPEPSRELPAFALEVGGPAARVLVAGPPRGRLPLDDFVEHLLAGRVAFEEGRLLRPLACPVAVTAPDVCRRCSAQFEHVVGLTSIEGVRPRYRVEGASVVALRDLWEADRDRARAVIAGVKGLRRAEPALSRVAPRVCPAVGENYLTALCPSCGAPQGDGAVDRLLTSLHPRAPVRVPIPPAPLTFRPLDGQPPRSGMGDWGEQLLPPRWRLRADDPDARHAP